APGLKVEQVGANHFHRFAPVVAHAHGTSVVFKDCSRLMAQFTQLRGIRALEPYLDAPARIGAQEELLGDGVGIGVLLVQMFLDVGNQPVDLPPVNDIDQELREGSVLSLWTVDEQEAQATAADE